MSAARALAAAALVGLLVPAAGCRMPRDTAALVDGRPVSTAELETAVRSLTDGFAQAAPALEHELPRIRRAALERLVERELMLAEAERRGLRADEGEIERALTAGGGRLPGEELDAMLARAGSDRESWRRAAARDLAVAKLQDQLAAAVTVGEAEVDARVARRQGGGELPEEVRASQILVRDAAAAREARRRILAGTPFADVARQVSQSPDATRGGDLGYFARGQMPPEFEEAAFGLPRGQLSDVVETPYGYHLFLVTDRRAARARSAAEERAAVRAALLTEKREAAFRAWVAKVRRRATIRYNRAIVPE
ncbi:MAG TPA: peptidylprolyl isomerase [Candidatus Methanoperedens sp.]|nr:peptidylprolyl isomerase [Candidatus Methanoperedens sp.]